MVYSSSKELHFVMRKAQSERMSGGLVEVNLLSVFDGKLIGSSYLSTTINALLTETELRLKFQMHSLSKNDLFYDLIAEIEKRRHDVCCIVGYIHSLALAKLPKYFSGPCSHSSHFLRLDCENKLTVRGETVLVESLTVTSFL